MKRKGKLTEGFIARSCRGGEMKEGTPELCRPGTPKPGNSELNRRGSEPNSSELFRGTFKATPGRELKDFQPQPFIDKTALVERSRDDIFSCSVGRELIRGHKRMAGMPE